LEQGGTFAGWAGPPIRALCLGVFGEAGLVGFKLLPSDVAGVSVGDQGQPLVTGGDFAGGSVGGEAALAFASEEERPGIAGVVQ